MRSRLLIFFVLTGLALFFVACEHEQATAPSSIPLGPTFSSIQANIFTPKCVNAGCHPGGGAPMSLASGQAYNALVNELSTAYGIDRVEPDDINNSALYLKVTGDNATGGTAFRMPLGLPPLNNGEINAIRDWINNGAQND